MNNNFVVMMVKRPACGSVKSRLGADIGTVAATSIYRTLMYNSIRTLARDPRWNFVLSITPDRSVSEPFWPHYIARIPQAHGDLGDRMQHIMNNMPPGKVIITGSDIAAMRPAHIARAFKKLGNADAVFSSAGDGGYSLVGLKRSPRIPRIFDNVRWSSAHTLEDTLCNLENFTTDYIDTLPDIDTADDWKAWKNQGIAGRLCF